MRNLFAACLILLVFSVSSAFAKPASKPAPKASDVTYFSCKVKEPLEDKNGRAVGEAAVTVKFAVANLDIVKGRGELINYPGNNEDDGMISVTPSEVKKKLTRMSNLNGQGGDLRITNNGDIRLFGDGDGYQFTDLVLWDDNDEELAHREGYVRDYGPTYGTSETFKQFIKCKKSKSPL